MGKTLIIKGADFSSVSIGQVELPRELSATALAWIEASNNSGFTDAQKYAIDDFITAIGVGSQGSIYSKIDRLWLPFLSADKAHSLVDYKSDGYVTPTLNETSQATWDNDVTFSNYGLKATSGNDTDSAPIIDSSLSIDFQNVSMFILNTLEFPTLGTGETAIHAGIGAAKVYNRYLFKASARTSIKYQINNSSTPVYVDTSKNRRQVALTGFISTSEVLRIMVADGTMHDADSPLSAETISDAGIRILRINGYKIQEDSIPHGAYIVAKALTNTEATTLKSAVETLFAAISA